MMLKNQIAYAKCAAAGALLIDALLMGAPAMARDVDPELRQTVIMSCSQDAFRLCPQSLGSEQEALTCMRAKRALLDHACRSAYDKVARVLAQ